MQDSVAIGHADIDPAIVDRQIWHRTAGYLESAIFQAVVESVAISVRDVRVRAVCVDFLPVGEPVSVRVRVERVCQRRQFADRKRRGQRVEIFLRLQIFRSMSRPIAWIFYC